MDIRSYLSLFVFLIFLILAIIHLYWVSGGKWALNAAFPTKNNAEKIMKFDYGLKFKIPTLIVAAGLLLFGLVALELGQWLHLLDSHLENLLGYSIAAIFALRAIGDFNYLGLFKKVKSTPFAKKDSSLYVPLCLFLSIALISLCL
jgi:hypothetical protein